MGRARERVQVSVTIISLGEGIKFLTKLWEWKMEFIVCLVFLSTALCITDLDTFFS